MERPITCRIACVKMVPGEVVPGTSAPPPPRDPVKRYQGPTRLGGAPTLTKAPVSGGDPARGAPPSPHQGPGVGGPPGPHGAGSGAGPPSPGSSPHQVRDVARWELAYAPYLLPVVIMRSLIPDGCAGPSCSTACMRQGACDAHAHPVR
jgi:hypothetical protein